jgi:predicted aspartyl protease
MALTFIDAAVANPANPRRSKKVSMLVDSGAVYSVVPKDVLRQLSIRPHSTKTFTLADGTEIRRRIGDALFKLDGYQAASPVIFGEKGQHASRTGYARIFGISSRSNPSRTPAFANGAWLAQGYL